VVRFRNLSGADTDHVKVGNSQGQIV